MGLAMCWGGRVALEKRAFWRSDQGGGLQGREGCTGPRVRGPGILQEPPDLLSIFLNVTPGMPRVLTSPSLVQD